MAKILNNHLYLLLGPEVGEKNLFLENLLKKVKAKEPVDFYKFYPYDIELNQILALMGTPSLFGETRFIVLANFDNFKKVELDALLPVIQHTANDMYIVVLSDLYKVDKRVEDLTPDSNKKIFWELKEEQKTIWVTNFFKKAGRLFNANAVNRLLELVENNTQELQIACEAVVGFYKPNVTLTEDEIDALIVHSKEENVFTLFSKLAGKELEASAEILSKMALSPDGIGVHTITMLTFQFRKVFAIKEALQQGQSLDEAFKLAAVSGKKNQATYKTAIECYSLDQLQTLLVTSAKYDAALRSGLNREMIKIALDSFLLSACQKRPSLV